MKVGTDGVLLATWAGVHNALNVLDVGTGCGVMAIILAQRAPQSFIHGVEIDSGAAAQAADNMAQSPWPGRLRCFEDSIQHFAATSGQSYDLIVSNPPFFSGGTFSDNHDRNAVRHTVKLPHGDLLSAVRRLLKPDGRFCVVLPHIEGLRFKELANNYHLYCTRMTQVYPRPDKPLERLLLQFETVVKPLEKETLTLHAADNNDLSEDWARLIGEFYLER